MQVWQPRTDEPQVALAQGSSLTKTPSYDIGVLPSPKFSY